MKRIVFLGDSLSCVKVFPPDARSEAGFQLRQVQRGADPADWKPMSSVGSGVREIRVRDESGNFRVIYLASVAESVLVLHAFQKKTQATPSKDIALAAKRLQTWRGLGGGN